MLLQCRLPSPLPQAVEELGVSGVLCAGVQDACVRGTSDLTRVFNQSGPGRQRRLEEQETRTAWAKSADLDASGVSRKRKEGRAEYIAVDVRVMEELGDVRALSHSAWSTVRMSSR